MNVICCVNDILMLIPSARGLQTLEDTANPVLKEHRVIVNRGKSSYFAFRHKKNITVPTLIRLHTIDSHVSS